MKIFYMKSLVSLLGVLLFLSSCNPLSKKCKDVDGNGVVSFYFEIPYALTPSKDTFKVGDTLWIESAFSNQMYNQRNGKTYSVIDFDFKLFGNILNLNTNPVMPTQSYKILNADGSLDQSSLNSGGDIMMSYTTIQGNYVWKKGIVFLEQGLFAYGLSSDISVRSLMGQSPPQHITECDDEYVSYSINRLNGNSNHYLLQYAADPYVKQWSAEQFKGSFAFYVKP
jgi:hypothetical protein